MIMIVSPAFKDETVRVEVPEMFAMNWISWWLTMVMISMVTMFMMMMMMMMTDLLTGPLSFPSLELPPARLRLKTTFLSLNFSWWTWNNLHNWLASTIASANTRIDQYRVPEVIDMADRSVEEHCYTMLVSCKADHTWLDLFPNFPVSDFGDKMMLKPIGLGWASFPVGS